MAVSSLLGALPGQRLGLAERSSSKPTDVAKRRKEEGMWCLLRKATRGDRGQVRIVDGTLGRPLALLLVLGSIDEVFICYLSESLDN